MFIFAASRRATTWSIRYIWSVIYQFLHKKEKCSKFYLHCICYTNFYEGNHQTCFSNHTGGGSLYDVTSCLAAWSQGGLCLWPHVPSRGLCLGDLCPGGLCPGNLCQGGVSVQGVSVGRPLQSQKSGQYASYCAYKLSKKNSHSCNWEYVTLLFTVSWM